MTGGPRPGVWKEDGEFYYFVNVLIIFILVESDLLLSYNTSHFYPVYSLLYQVQLSDFTIYKISTDKTLKISFLLGYCLRHKNHTPLTIR